MKNIFLLLLSICFLQSSYDYNYNKSSLWKNYDSINYDSLYIESQAILDSDISKSIMLLQNIIDNSMNKNLVLNSYYDLAQIYVSRSTNFSKSIYCFEQILNQRFIINTKTKNNLKNIDELKEKSMFMIAYIYHNHIGNLSLANEHYSKFLELYSDSDLGSSVRYELNIIKNSIKDFNKINN